MHGVHSDSGLDGAVQNGRLLYFSSTAVSQSAEAGFCCSNKYYKLPGAYCKRFLSHSCYIHLHPSWL